MESQYQRTSTTPTGHENHGVHVCHKCGRPFPNPHPSAKHRRAHKRICGTIEGYKQTNSEVHMNLVVSDDEHMSDEYLRTPSPKIETESGGVGERSNRSEDEVFSDAVTEFLDNGFSPGSGERIEGARELDKNVEKVVDGDLALNQLLKADVNIDIVHPPNDLSEKSQIHNPKVLETNHSGKTAPLQDIAPNRIADSMVGSEKYASGLSSTNGTVCDSSHKKLETFAEAPKDYINSNSGTNGIESMTSLEQESDRKRNEKNNLDKSLPEGGFLEVSDRGREGTEDFHVLSEEYDLPIVDIPEVMVEDFKDCKGMKVNRPIALGFDEVIRCVKDETNEPAIEESYSNFDFIKSGERIDIYSQDTVTLEDKQKEKADTNEVKVTSGVDGNTSEIKVINTEDLGSSGLEASLDPPIQGLQRPDFDNYSSHSMLSESLLGEVDTRNLGKGGIEFSVRAGDQSTKSVAEEICPRKTETTIESECNFSESHLSDRIEGNLEDTESTDIKKVSNSSEGSIDTTDLVNTIDIHSNSQNCQVEDSEEALSTDTRSNHDSDDDVLQRSRENPIFKEPELLSVHSEFSIKSNAVSSDEPLQEEGDGYFTKQLVAVSAVDVSVDSSSLTDSLEGNWGSVSVLSTQSDAPTPVGSQAQGQSQTAILQKPKNDQSDAFEAPSFMTLVEPRNGVDHEAVFNNTKQPKTEASQAGWFPTITNVVNESQGRKKNEEIIAKVTNWSTVKQHTPLKSFLGEANLETKPKSPKPKQAPTLIQNNGVLAPTTLNSILQAAKNDTGKEWNSPALYPKENKKEKRKVKGKTYWVQFVCCYSVN